MEGPDSSIQKYLQVESLTGPCWLMELETKMLIPFFNMYKLTHGSQVLPCHWRISSAQLLQPLNLSGSGRSSSRWKKLLYIKFKIKRGKITRIANVHMKNLHHFLRPNSLTLTNQWREAFYTVKVAMDPQQCQIWAMEHIKIEQNFQQSQWRKITTVVDS